MSWQIYLLISILLISFIGLLQRSLMKDDRANPQAHTIAFLGVGGIFAIILALFEGKLNLYFPSFLLWNFVLLVILITPAYLLNYRAYKQIGASEVVLFLATGRLWNVVGAYIFLHESVSVQQIFGAIVIVLGVAITRFEQRKFIFNSGVFFALIAAFLYGMSDIDGYYILRFYDATNFLIYAEFLPVIAIMLLQPKSLAKLTHYFHIDTAIKLLILCICDIFGTLALFLAYQVGGKASIIGPLSATRVLIATILAIIILHERKNITNKIIGTIVTIVGVLLLL
ncbi:MAG TPA: DMT family transporter [Patescibacteria group bacterium]|nr:DMT family transporter [Patescibacteria group bacterium]